MESATKCGRFVRAPFCVSRQTFCGEMIPSFFLFHYFRTLGNKFSAGLSKQILNVLRPFLFQLFFQKILMFFSP